MNMHENRKKVNDSVPTLDELLALARRLKLTPTLTENQSGFLNVALHTFNRAKSGDVDSQVTAFAIADKLMSMATDEDTVNSNVGTFAENIWRVERRPQKSRWHDPEFKNAHPIITTHCPVAWGIQL